MKRSVVLLSSGLDSTVNLFEARERSEVLAAITFNYGQRAAAREIAMASAQLKPLGIQHILVDVPFFADFTKTSLVNRDREVPTENQVSIDDRETSMRTAERVWVPNRNGILLNIGAGYAEGLDADWLIPGFNIEEGATFPDNTEEYLRALSYSFSYSTANHVEVVCFTTAMDKTAIVKRGVELGVNFEHVWPCYFGGEKLCGQCESCLRYKRARLNAGVPL